jgi:hypothetical protein
MKRGAHFLLILASICCFLLSSCEDDSGGSSSTQGAPDFAFYDDSIVRSVNQGESAGTTIPHVITADGQTLYFTSSTTLSVMRPSCSGFAGGGLSGSLVGQNIRFYYDMEAVDFTTVPPRFYPTEVYIWSEDCDNPWGNPRPK